MDTATLPLVFTKDVTNTIHKNLIHIYQETWERRSSIRTRPTKPINFEQNGYFFPEAKQPLLLNPEIINKGEQVKQEILLQSFKKYLTDIITLEINIIDAACRMIIDDKLPIIYGDQIKINTYTIMIDEYYHVYTAKNILRQINEQFPQLKNLKYPISDASHAVYQIQSRLDTKYHNAFHLIAVCIFETTLVRELIDFFNTPSIHPCIKHYVNDHMNDEAKHSGFFFDLLCYTWESLPLDFKNEIGGHLADFIQLYLHIDSDRFFYQSLCESILNNKEKASKIVNELYKGFAISLDIPIVKNVINVLRKSNIISYTATQASFAKAGWKI